MVKDEFVPVIENIEEVIAALEDFVEDAERLGKQIEVGGAGLAQPRVRAVTPVDTGKLRKSVISVNDTVRVGAPYWWYVHAGTKHFEGQPFLREGISESYRGIIEMAEQKLADAIHDFNQEGV